MRKRFAISKSRTASENSEFRGRWAISHFEAGLIHGEIRNLTYSRPQMTLRNPS
jgi:hypothetical protein